MNTIKLKRLFILCVIVLLVLIIATSCDFSEIIRKEEIIQPTDTNIEGVHKFEEFDYNNLTTAQMDYLSNIYSNNVMFTEKGVEVYFESAFSGKLNKIITSKWPEADIANLIPKPEFGKISKIEYAERWINIYISETSQNDMKNYLKEVKKYNFTENEEKDDGKVLLGYKTYDEFGNSVQITFYKDSKMLEISVKKVD